MPDKDPTRPRATAAAPPLTPSLLRPLLQTVAALSRTIESRDPYSAGHQARVSALGRAIAQAMHLSPDAIEAIRVAGTLHDLGMSDVPGEIIGKTEPLDAAERGVIRRHAAQGAEALDGIAFPWPIADIVRQHHERMDGSGYPAGLKGDAIRLEARILAVADVFESLTSARPHRRALAPEAALAEIGRGAGPLFDAEVVAACRAVIQGGWVPPGSGA